MSLGVIFSITFAALTDFSINVFSSLLLLLSKGSFSESRALANFTKVDCVEGRGT